MHTFVLSDPSRCIGCRACEIACVDVHMNEDMALAMEKQLPFSPGITIVHEAEVTVPIQCRQCEDAPCAAVCPAGAVEHGPHGVQVNAEHCCGCKTCMAVCPIGAIKIEILPSFPGRRLAHKCDLCAGRQEGPACVTVCPADALAVLSREKLQRISGSKRRQGALQLVFGNR